MSQYLGSTIGHDEEISVLIDFYVEQYSGDLVYEDLDGALWTPDYLENQNMIIAQSNLIKILYGVLDEI